MESLREQMFKPSLSTIVTENSRYFLHCQEIGGCRNLCSLILLIASPLVVSQWYLLQTQ
jgi:hypothetical protein